MINLLFSVFLAFMPADRTQTGWHTWYGDGKFHGRITATGEKFNPHALTCASRSIKLHSLVVVQSLDTGNFTGCRVNDRGPYGAKLKNGEWAIMYKKRGVWYTKHKDEILKTWSVIKSWLKKPGKYRGIMDLSLGTARSLYRTDGRPPNGKIKVYYWR